MSLLHLPNIYWSMSFKLSGSFNLINHAKEQIEEYPLKQKFQIKYYNMVEKKINKENKYKRS